MPRPGPGPRGLWLLIFLLPTFAIVALSLAGPLSSGDLWWHLNTGEWILEHGELPQHDPFSHTAGDKHWTLEEYGSQILFAGLNELGGTFALRSVGTLLGLLLLWSVWRTARRDLDPPWALFMTAAFAVLFALKWELRPHLLSAFLFLRLQRRLFPRERQDPDKAVWIEVFVLAVLWTQLHAEAIFIPILASAGAIGAFIGGVLQKDGGFARLRAWLILLGLGLVGTLLSPEGWNQHLYAVAESSTPRTYIEEWFPSWVLPGDPRFHPLNWALFACVALAILSTASFVLYHGLTRLLKPSKLPNTEQPHGESTFAPSWERIGFGAVCILMAILARRFFWLTWFPLLDICVALGAKRRHSPVLLRTALAAALILPIILATTHYATRSRMALVSGKWSSAVDDGLFPVHAADFARDAGLEGNLFHPYEWGGYLGWMLYPNCAVYLDGRTVLFAEVIPERWRAERDAEYGRQCLDARDVRLIIFDRGDARAPWKPPAAHTEWIRVWTDRRAEAWVRADDDVNLGRVHAYWAGHNVDFDKKRGLDHAEVLFANPGWLTELNILPNSVSELLAPMYENGNQGRHLDRARAYLQSNMRRSAKWELERALDQHYSWGSAEHTRWHDILASKGVSATLPAWLSELNKP